MTETDARAAVYSAIQAVAPDVDAAAVADTDRLRQDLDLDSLDFLRLLESIAAATGVDTPEDDYPKVRTVGGLVHYLLDAAQ
jgi:acyl carrier protein